MKLTALTDLLLLLIVFSYNSAAAAQSPGAFLPTGSMTIPRISHTATLLLDGKVLIAGGGVERDMGGRIVNRLRSAELFNPITGMFTATGDMTTGRHGNSATLLPDGRVLIAGGAVPDGSLATAELYDPATGAFIPTGNMVT